jgi:thiamine-monophosphate kinase
MVEGVHFDDSSTPEQVGRKLVAVNVSDIAACGATPLWAVLTICVPNPFNRDWVKRFSDGLNEALREHNVALIGGDTTRSTGGISLTLTVGGEHNGSPILRTGASPNQTIWVSGNLGDASGGFNIPGAPEPLTSAHRNPAPPTALGPRLVGIATAAMDLSDGLSRDIHRLCKASECGAVIYPERLPASSFLRKWGGNSLLTHQVGFGEDYELLFVAQESSRENILAIAAELDVKVTPIGETTKGSEVILAGDQWPKVWHHFGQES